jgi:hypothetical protein
MNTPGPDTAVYLFETTTFVLWAEEVARELDIPSEVIPAPPPRGDLCGTALRVLRADTVALERAMEGAGISFHRHGDRADSDS